MHMLLDMSKVLKELSISLITRLKHKIDVINDHEMSMDKRLKSKCASIHNKYACRFLFLIKRYEFFTANNFISLTYT